MTQLIVSCVARLARRGVTSLALLGASSIFGCSSNSSPSDPLIPAEAGIETGSGICTGVKGTDSLSSVGNCHPTSEAGSEPSAEVGSDATPEATPDVPDAAAPETKDDATDAVADTAEADVATPPDTSDAAETPAPDAGAETLDATPDATPSDTSSDAPDGTVVTPASPLATSWIIERDGQFNGLLLDGLTLQVTSSVVRFGSNAYIGTGTWGQGAIAKCDDTTCTLGLVMSTASSYLMSINGDSETNLCAAGYDDFGGHLYHLASDGTWPEDPNQPATSAGGGFESVWCSGSHSVLVGGDGGASRIWLNDGLGWVSQTLPLPIGAGSRSFKGQIYALDPQHLFIPGFYADSFGDAISGFILYYDGTSWTEVSAPSDARELNGISGSSLGDMYATSDTSEGAVIYHITSSLGTWTPYVNSALRSYDAVWSQSPGSVIAAGVAKLDVNGSLSLTSLNSAMRGQTISVDDKKAYDVTGFWFARDGKSGDFVNLAGGKFPAGHYTLRGI